MSSGFKQVKRGIHAHASSMTVRGRFIVVFRRSDRRTQDQDSTFIEVAMSPINVSTATTGAYSSPFTLRSAARAVEAGVAKDLTSADGAPLSATPSSTVSLSSAGVGLLEGLGQSVANVAKGGAETAVNAVELPVDVATDIASGLVGAAEGVAKVGWDLVSGDFGSVTTDAGATVRSLVADAPAAVISDVASDVKSIASDGATLASGVLGLSSLGAL